MSENNDLLIDESNQQINDNEDAESELLLQQLIDVVKVDSFNKHNLQHVFLLILNKSINFTSEDCNILDNFGVALAGCDKLLEAFYCFQEILKIDGKFLKSYQNLDNVRNQLIERWHFRMLNDVQRNAAYRNALTTSIKTLNRKHVLDIGTGTGLLALFAQKCGAIEINACDDSTIMLNIAKEVFKNDNKISNYMFGLLDSTKNNKIINPINLIEKHSNSLTIADLKMNNKMDLIVTEIFDSGIFGEGILQTLIYAKEYLLNDNGQIIPDSVDVYIAGFESRTIAYDNISMNAGFTDLIYLKGHKLVIEALEPYDSENVRQIKDFKILTKTELAFTIHFNNLIEMKQYLCGEKCKKIRLEYQRTGFLDGFVVWFQLNLDKENRIQSIPTEQSCWDQAIFKLNHRFANLEKLKYLNVTISCKNGILNVEHYYNFPGKIFPINQNILKFINDTVYINKLEYDFFADCKLRPNKKFDIVLDFSPFPYIGISLMKEKRTKRLYCSRDAQDFVCFVALCNCLPYENIIFLKEPNDILYQSEYDNGEHFDLIILSLIDPLGCINSNQISIYHLLKLTKLKPNGFIIPERIELWAELIKSDWLTTVSRCVNQELQTLKIAELINQFETVHQLDLLSFDHEKLSNPFYITDIRLDDKFQEKFIRLKIKPNATTESINGILYYFKIHFINSSESLEPISTKRNYSFIRRACFVCNNNLINNNNNNNNNDDDVDMDNENNYKANIQFIQNHGVIKCLLR